jgi:hypothetical protein
MKRLICICLLCLFLLPACARRIMPPPPDMTAAITAVANSNLPPEQKPAVIEKILNSAKEQYAMLLARYESEGRNIKDTFLQILALGSVIANLTLTATK